MTPLEKMIITLRSLADTTQKCLDTHTETEIARWLLYKLKHEVKMLDYELNEGVYSDATRK
jgi:hypothetical protein